MTAYSVADLPERMQTKIVVTAAGCWEWVGARQLHSGYGIFDSNGPGPSGPHRRAYLLLVGPIPDGYQVDHLCANPPCCNPAHLEAVTPEVNRARIRRPEVGKTERARIEQAETMQQIEDALYWMRRDMGIVAERDLPIDGAA